MKLGDSLNFPSVNNLMGPKREIEIPENIRDKVESAVTLIQGSDLSNDYIYSLFSDWKSKRTISSRRFVFAISFIVFVNSFLFLDLSEITLFGVDFSSGDHARFVFLYTFMVSSVLILYLFSMSVDRAVKKARLSEFDYYIKPCKKAVSYLESIKSDLGVDKIEDIVDDFSDRVSQDFSYLKTLAAVDLYVNKLEKHSFLNKLLEFVEVVLIVTVSVFSIYLVNAS